MRHSKHSNSLSGKEILVAYGARWITKEVQEARVVGFVFSDG
jgi:hypothetical protein